MKEITMIATAEITVIYELDDEELDEFLRDKEKTTHAVENELKKATGADDVQVKVQLFVRDMEDDDGRKSD